MTRAQSEHSLQTEVIRYLTRYHVGDVFWFAVPNAGRRTFSAAAKLRAEGMLRGVPDLCIVLPAGRTGWLELKSATGALSDDQKGFRARCRRLDHQYATARTLEEAKDHLRSWRAVDDD
jgi:hypothetical protein